MSDEIRKYTAEDWMSHRHYFEGDSAGVRQRDDSGANANLDKDLDIHSLEGQAAEDIVAWAVRAFPEGLAMSSSFGIQSVVLLHLVTRVKPDIPIIVVDTGYLPPETYKYIVYLADKWNLNLKVYQSKMSPAFMESIYGQLWKPIEDAKIDVTTPLHESKRDSPSQASAYTPWNVQEGEKVRAQKNEQDPLSEGLGDEDDEELLPIDVPQDSSVRFEAYNTLRKVEPMERALRELGVRALFSGVRKEQTKNRKAMKVVNIRKLKLSVGGGVTRSNTRSVSEMKSEIRENKISRASIKVENSGEYLSICPILDWTQEEVESYFRLHSLPRHPLQSKGYTTVGDAHSSRPKQAGDGEGATGDRQTRFGGAHQECGLHLEAQGHLATEMLAGKRGHGSSQRKRKRPKGERTSGDDLQADTVSSGSQQSRGSPPGAEKNGFMTRFTGIALPRNLSSSSTRAAELLAKAIGTPALRSMLPPLSHGTEERAFMQPHSVHSLNGKAPDSKYKTPPTALSEDTTTTMSRTPSRSATDDTPAPASLLSLPSTTIVFSKTSCGQCLRAKRLLKSMGILFNELRVGQDLSFVELTSLLGRSVKTVPQIIIEGKYIGGADDLVRAVNSGDVQSRNDTGMHDDGERTASGRSTSDELVDVVAC